MADFPENTIDSVQLLILDFDGVVAIPWTNPEEHYPQIPEAVRMLHAAGYVLCIASYNPRAFEAVKRWGLDKYFAAVRCGANHAWHTSGEKYKEDDRLDMRKHRQILNMLETDMTEKNVNVGKIVFFDDDVDNISLVQRELPHVESIHVDEKEGFRLHLLPV